METGLKIKNLNKSYGELEIFRDFSVSFHQGRINCILGPSGCGKTTLLNIIGGTLQADSIAQNDFMSRRFSYVFQEPRLLPWKTVKENLVFTLKDILPPKNLNEVADEYLKWVELEKFRDYFPAKLSGGMKQRLSLARAFSFPSDIILMDEPFKALDVKLKNNLINRFLELWNKDKRTVLFVTHEVDEAISLGHKISLLAGPPVQIIKEYEIKDKGENTRNEILELLHNFE